MREGEYRQLYLNVCLASRQTRGRGENEEEDEGVRGENQKGKEGLERQEKTQESGGEKDYCENQHCYLSV